MPHLELSGISKSFDSTQAVHDLNLSVERGEILSILGPSGCGKTTTLRMIAGLEIPTSGAILSNSRDITNLPARERNMGMVFQNYALFPHLNVFENVAFGLRTRRLAKNAIEARVAKALASVRMEGFAKRQVHQMSGGQQQRIALARALAIEPEVLLLDEPLSNLDPSLREDLRDQIRSIIRELSVTTVIVTHDQQEAFALADRIAIMESGVCRQFAPPEEVYNRPADAFVARFLGKANLLPALPLGNENGFELLEIAKSVKLKWRGSLPHGNGRPLIFLRPENVLTQDSDEFLKDSATRESFPATVTKIDFEGSIVHYTLDLNGTILTSRRFQRGQRTLRIGEKIQVSIPSGHFHVIAAP